MTRHRPIAQNGALVTTCVRSRLNNQRPCQVPLGGTSHSVALASGVALSLRETVVTPLKMLDERDMPTNRVTRGMLADGRQSLDQRMQRAGDVVEIVVQVGLLDGACALLCQRVV